MNRNYRTEAVVLKTRRFGDFHKSVTILSPENGIIEAVAHGVYKGKSRISSLTDPFCISEFELYHNPAKDSWTINGCEAMVPNSRIRENLNAVYCASFWSELVLKSHASGADFRTVFEICTTALSSLDEDNTAGRIITVHFLYRFLLNSGFITDFSECGHCGAFFSSKTETAERLYFSPDEGCFLCSKCASAGLPFIKAEAVAYLEDSSANHLAEAVKKRLDLQTEKETLNILLEVLKSIIGTPLKTLEYIDYGME